jgi:TonB family protein
MAIESPNAPRTKEIRFAHFGILNAGKQGKGSVFSSITINVIVALILLLLSTAAAKKAQLRLSTTRLEAPIPVVIVKPKPIPKPLPRPPIVKVEPPRHVPQIEVPEPPKTQTIVAKAPSIPTPNPTPAAPKRVNPAPAPAVISIQHAKAASIANNSPNPSPIRLGSMTNPINNTSGPAVSKIDLGHSGAPGMPGSNTGLGPPSKINIAGSGSPDGRTGGTANAPHAIAGIKLGTPGGTGPSNARPVGAIQIASSQGAPPVHPAYTPTGGTKTPPKVVFKPRPQYTAEARQLHLEGTVYVKIHVSATGAVQVVGVSSGLGHGLDQEAVRAVQAMRFQPATENGHPVDWDGVVNINFQLAD